MSIAGSEQETPEKVHIRGVDDLTTEDIKAFAAEHFPSMSPLRIEWIDDTSANIVYETASAASEALHCLSVLPSNGTPLSLQLRAAKQFSSHPESSLQVRIALFTDQKRPRAYEASRFYMMHPEYDPREQRRRDKSNRNGHGDYQRRRYSQKEHRRRVEGDSDGQFDPAMYDDEPGTSHRADGLSTKHASRSSPVPSSDDRSRRRRDTYRPGGSNSIVRGTRDRSASPGLDREEYSGRSGRRNIRERTPPPPYQTRHPFPVPVENSGKELFPSKPRLRRDDDKNGKELFPHTIPVKKELFPNKTSTSNHRRSDAFDAADETTADQFTPVPSVPLVDRITKPHASLSPRLSKSKSVSYGRLNSDPEPMALEALDDDGLNIRGGALREDSGFQIRGAAEDAAYVGKVKELFPGKAMGNAGKELFAEKLQGRGGKRNKAEDMFY